MPLTASNLSREKLRKKEMNGSGLSPLKSFFRCNQKLWLGVGKVKLELLCRVSLVQRRRYGSASNHCQEHHHKLHKTKNKKVKILNFVYCVWLARKWRKIRKKENWVFASIVLGKERVTTSPGWIPEASKREAGWSTRCCNFSYFLLIPN